MLSPRWQSPRISSQSEIVNDVPPPPDAVLSSSSRDETASHDQLSSAAQQSGAEWTLTADSFNEPGKHCGGGVAIGGGGVRQTSELLATNLGLRTLNAGMQWGACNR